MRKILFFAVVLISFTLKAQVISPQSPYTEDFEGITTGWVLENGTQTNQWVIGTAPNTNKTTGGTHGLYVSNDNGASHAYDGTQASKVFAIKTLQFTNAGQHLISYDWRCQGKANFFSSDDYLSVWLAPDAATITAGSSPATGSWIPLWGSMINVGLYGQSSWQHKDVSFILPQAGTYKLVFYWVNVASLAANNPPATIDNISIVAIDCSAPPANVWMSHINRTGATVHFHAPVGVQNVEFYYKEVVAAVWDSINIPIFNATGDTTLDLSGFTAGTTYEIYTRSKCGTEFSEPGDTIQFTTLCEQATPFTQDFEYVVDTIIENGDTTILFNSNSVPPCWSYIHTYGNMGPSTSSPHSGSYCYYIVNNPGYNTSGESMLISPYVENLNSLRVTFWARAQGGGSAGLLTVGYMNDPSDISTFRPVHSISAPSGWTKYRINFDTVSAPQNGYYIAFNANQYPNWNNIYIDDITIEPIPDCPDIENIAFTAATDANSITLSFTAQGTMAPNSYNVRYREAGIAGWQNTIFNASPGTITGLSPNTAYEICLQSDCGGISGAWSDMVTVTTLQLPVPVPFTEDFEGQNPDWMLSSSVSPLGPKWYIGTAANTNNTQGGAYGLYISDDNGSTNSYNGTAASDTYVYKTLYFSNPGTYTIAYDWKAYGRYTWDDYLQVWLAPANAVTTEGSAPATEGWINLYGSDLNAQSAWQHKQREFTLQQSGNYKLVFYWKNRTASSPGNPPAAVDNISVAAVPCSAPVNINIDNITQTTSTIHFHALDSTQIVDLYYKSVDSVNWNVINIPISDLQSDTVYTVTGLVQGTQYQVYLKSVCGESGVSSNSPTLSFTTECGIPVLPLFEGFEQLSASIFSLEVPTCWSYIKTGGSDLQALVGSPFFGYAAHSGQKLYQITSADNASESMLITPYIANLNTVRVKFWTQKSTWDQGRVTVGYMSDASDTSTFHPVYAVDCPAVWTEYIVRFDTVNAPLPGYYIAFSAKNPASLGQSIVYLDDITIDSIINCPDVENIAIATGTSDTSIVLSFTTPDDIIPDQYDVQYRVAGTSTWQNTTFNASPGTITGLTPATSYEIQIQSHCGSALGALNNSNTFSTFPIPGSIPFFEDFEGTIAWELVNGSGANGPLPGASRWHLWHIGGEDSTARTGGENGLYITPCWDAGKSNLYRFKGAPDAKVDTMHPNSAHRETSVYATRVLRFDNAGDYGIKYNWKAYGRLDSADHMEVWLVPATTTITAGVTPANLGNTNWINLYGTANLACQSTWSRPEIEFTVPSAGLYKVVFYWYNLAYGDAYNPPAAVDDISITAVTCSAPKNVSIDSITATTANVYFQAPAAAQSVYVYYKAFSASAWDSVQVAVSDTVYRFTGLASETQYQVYLRAFCSPTEKSYASSIQTFHLLCTSRTLPYFENFGRNVFPPICWDRMEGKLPADGTEVIFTPYNMTGRGSVNDLWRNGNSANSSAMLMNYFVLQNPVEDWMISPVINLGSIGNAVLEFDLALTHWNSLDSATGITDDKLMVLVSGNNNWTLNDTIAVWDSINPNRIFDSIAVTGQHVTIPLTGMTGEVRIAFYAEKTISDGDNDLSITNISVQSPVCNPVTTVTTTQATVTSVQVDWTTPAGQTQWKVVCKQASNIVASQIVSTPTHTFTNLQRGVAYTFEVQNICGANDTSIVVVSDLVTISTCDEVSNVVLESVCPTTAIVSWAAVSGQTQWQLSYQSQPGGTVITKEVSVTRDTLRELTPNTAYEMKIRPICGEGDTGEYTAPLTLQTGYCDTVEHILVPRTDLDDSIFVSWYNNGCHQDWQISVVPLGSPVDADNAITTSTYQGTYVKVTNPLANYDVYVKGNCGNGLYSPWNKATSIVTGIGVLTSQSVKVTLMPNPARENTKLSVDGVTGNIEMVLMTVDGKVISKENFLCQPETKKEIVLTGLAKGTYLIRLTHKDWTKVERLIVQ